MLKQIVGAVRFSALGRRGRSGAKLAHWLRCRKARRTAEDSTREAADALALDLAVPDRDDVGCEEEGRGSERQDCGLDPRPGGEFAVAE